jgi:hypothetical protein
MPGPSRSNSAGAHVGYCLTKAIGAQNQPAPPIPGGESIAGGSQAS